MQLIDQAARFIQFSVAPVSVDLPGDLVHSPVRFLDPDKVGKVLVQAGTPPVIPSAEVAAALVIDAPAGWWQTAFDGVDQLRDPVAMFDFGDQQGTV